MSRGVWFVAGAGAGVYAVFRGRRAAEALSIDGITDRINGVALGLRLLRDEVAQGRSEKETELRERLAVAPAGPTRLTAGSARTHPEHHPEHQPDRHTGGGTEEEDT